MHSYVLEIHCFERDDMFYYINVFTCTHMGIILRVIKQEKVNLFCALILRRHRDGHFLTFYILINALCKYSAHKVLLFYAP